MSAATPTAVWTGSARTEAVAVFANMTMSALEGGGDERLRKDHHRPPRPARGDYLRQSSMAQVREHTESTTRQYGLAEESVRRVCCGEVGAIFGIEISRLARSAPRWRG